MTNFRSVTIDDNNSSGSESSSSIREHDHNDSSKSENPSTREHDEDESSESESSSIKEHEDDAKEGAPLLGRIPHGHLSYHARIRELYSLLETRLGKAAITLISNILRLQRFASFLLIDTKKLILALQTWISENPKEFTAICIGVVLFALACAAPAILGAIGFSAVGPVAGSMAAAWQASMGTVAAGSLFAFLQSAAMGGAAIGLFAGIGTVGGLIVLFRVGANVKAVEEKVSKLSGVVRGELGGAGVMIKSGAVQVGGAVAAGAVRACNTMGGWWGRMKEKMKGE